MEPRINIYRSWSASEQQRFLEILQDEYITNELLLKSFPVGALAWPSDNKYGEYPLSIVRQCQDIWPWTIYGSCLLAR